MPDTPNPDAQTPPWGDNFDAERAWTLLQNVRADLTKAKDDLTVERQARTKAEDDLKASDPSGKLADADKATKEAQKALYIERALRKFSGLDESLVEFLSGDTEEEVLAKAERLANIGKPPAETPPAGDKPADGETPPTGGDLPGKPTPSLAPGHGGETPTPFDPVAIAKAARNSF